MNMKWSIQTDNLISFGFPFLIFFDMRFRTATRRVDCEVRFTPTHCLFSVFSKSKTFDSKCLWFSPRNVGFIQLKIFWWFNSVTNQEPIKENLGKIYAFSTNQNAVQLRILHLRINWNSKDIQKDLVKFMVWRWMSKDDQFQLIYCKYIYDDTGIWQDTKR